MAKVPPFSELIAATTSSAVHLETRDAYTPDDPQFLDWLAGKPLPVPAQPRMVSTCPRPRCEGRASSVVPASCPSRCADYIRFEHAITDEMNVSAGEDVRWLPRRRAPACACR